MVAAVRRGTMDYFLLRYGNPGAVDLHFVVIVDRAAGRWTTVGEVATRAFAIGPLQGVVEALMPFVVAGAEVTLLGMSGKGSGKGQCENQNGEPRTHARSPPVKKAPCFADCRLPDSRGTKLKSIRVTRPLVESSWPWPRGSDMPPRMIGWGGDFSAPSAPMRNTPGKSDPLRTVSPLPDSVARESTEPIPRVA